MHPLPRRTVTVLLLSLLAPVACGYQSLHLHRGDLEVARTRSRAPHPELTGCLDRALDRELTRRTTRAAPARRARRLEVEILEAQSRAALITGDHEQEPRELTREARLLVRARVRTISGGAIVWGPEAYEVHGEGMTGSTAVASYTASTETAARACRRLARRIIDDVLTFLATGDD